MILCGTWDTSVFPIPSWPSVLIPKDQQIPSKSKQTLKYIPQDTFFIFGINKILVGTQADAPDCKTNNFPSVDKKFVLK